MLEKNLALYFGYLVMWGMFKRIRDEGNLPVNQAVAEPVEVMAQYTLFNGLQRILRFVIAISASQTFGCDG